MWLAIPEYSILVTCLATMTSLGDLKTQVLRTENIGVFSELGSAVQQCFDTEELSSKGVAS
jgi:hypothetical protein